MKRIVLILILFSIVFIGGCVSQCKGPGETVVVRPGGDVCCEGLDYISPTTPEQNCSIMAGASICSDCGNGNCEEWENFCNCPEDCPSDYICPDKNTISCLPVPLPQDEKYCRGTYQNWIIMNCPGIEFNY